jgi:TrmH family RNA methyltransferase
MGNLGTVMRTAAAFGVPQIVVCGTLDVHHPKVIRASMGAYYHGDAVVYDDFNAYRGACGEREMYPFMLQAKALLTEVKRPPSPVSMIFGNEARGLDDGFLNVGQPLRIAHSNAVDSLSLPMAVTVAAVWLRR